MRRRASRRRRGDAFGMIFIALGVLALGGLGFAGYLLRPPPLDSETLCRRDRAPSAHTIVLVDATDALAPRHRRRLQAVIDQERARLRPEERLSVYALAGAAPQEPRRLFSMCLPRDGAQANPLFENPQQAQSQWDERVGRVLTSALWRAARTPAQSASPIIAGMRAVVSEPGFETGARRLVILSDMLEHTPQGFSLYAADADYARWRSAAPVDPPDLAGAAVRVALFDRPEHVALQHVALRDFWADFFEATGAASVRIEPGA